MPLEVFTNPDRQPNIKEVALDAEKSEFQPHFIPERDISEQDWQEMVKELEVCRREANRDKRDKFVPFLADLAAINQAKALSLISEKEWQEQFQRLREMKETFHTGFRIEASNVAIVDRAKVLPLVTEDDWLKMIKEFENYPRNTLAFIDVCSSLAQLDVAKLRSLLSKEDWEAMIGQLNRHWKVDSVAYISIASKLATIDSHKVIPLISEERWGVMKRGLETYRNERNWRGFGTRAARLAILSKAEAGEQKSSADFSSATPLPQVRNF